MADDIKRVTTVIDPGDVNEGTELYVQLRDLYNAQVKTPRQGIIACTQLLVDAYKATGAVDKVSDYLRKLAEIYKRQGL